jgi:hypothetical protein
VADFTADRDEVCFCAAMKRLVTVVGLTLATTLGHAERLVDYVAPSLLEGTNDAPRRVSVSVTNFEATVQAPRRVTEADRWQKFEAEFGIEKREESPVLGSIQTAKYQLDKTTFVLQETLNKIEESLRFDYGLSDLGLPVSPPKPYRPGVSYGLVDSLQGARLKSEVDLKLARDSFVGVKLELPLGN